MAAGRAGAGGTTTVNAAVLRELAGAHGVDAVYFEKDFVLTEIVHAYATGLPTVSCRSATGGAGHGARGVRYPCLAVLVGRAGRACGFTSAACSRGRAEVRAASAANSAGVGGP